MKIVFAGGSGHSDRVISTYKTIPGAEATAFCRTGRLENPKVSTSIPGIKEYADAIEMMVAEKPDILVSDGFFNTHAPIAAEALRRGIAVISDKPAATTFADYQMLAGCVHKPGAPLYWGFLTSRYQDCFYTVKKLVEEGAVGTVRMLNSQKSYTLGNRHEFYRHAETYGGTIPWISIHAIDWMAWVSGLKYTSAYSVQSSAYNRGHGDLEMTAISVFEMENGCTASVHSDYYRPDGSKIHGDDRLRVTGTDGILEVRGSQVYLLNAENDGEKPLPLLSPPRPLFPDFVHALQGRTGSLITPEDTLYATYVALKARESAETHEKVLL